MNRDEKAVVIERLVEDIRGADAIFAVDYRGISVPQAAELRTKLRAADARFAVVKNSLTERAADEAGAPDLKPLLSGPTALTFVRGDAAAAAKALADMGRATQFLEFKGGTMDGAALSPSDIQSIARLPSRDVLYGQLVGVVASPISGLARGLNALLSGVAIALGQIRDQGKVGGDAPAPEAPAETEAPAAEPEAEAPAEPETPAEAETAAEPEAAAEPETEAPAEAETAAEPEAAAEPEPEGPADTDTDTETPQEDN
jgi:large subunit ribosomal protein L10